MKTRSLVYMVVPVVVAFAFAASAGAASAQTTFQATVKSVANKANAAACTAAGHTICGTAKVVGYGSVRWTFDDVTFGPLGMGKPQCTPYTGIHTFYLPSGTLVLDDTGVVCAPGGSAYALRKSRFNAPWTNITATWTVDPTSTGAFAGLSGTGTESAQITGPATLGTFTGTLGS
jgi:hypothetical protein